MYLKSGLRPPAVLVAEKDWGWKEERRELRKMEEVEAEEGENEEGEVRTRQMGETVLREWVRDVKVCARWGVFFGFVF